MKYILITLFLFSCLSFALSEKEEKIADLLENEIHMIEKVRNKKSRLLYRLLELYSERLGIIKKKENEVFLKQFAKRNMKKAEYFKKSISEYKKVKSFGYTLLKKYPKTKYKADVYYTLALNSRDFGNDNQTERLLLKSLKFTKERQLRQNTMSALADFYYNEKKYKKAISLYRTLLEAPKDEWLSKNTFNLAWCLLKVKKNELALNRMKEAYYLAGKPGYINIQDQVLSNLPLFFSINKKIQEGFAFFVEKVKEPAEYILKMARRATENGDFAGGLFLVNNSKKRFRESNQELQLLRVHVFELVFYTTFKRWKKHLQASTDIVNLNKTYKFKPEYLEESINKLKAHAGSLQKKITRNVKSGFASFEADQYTKTLTYFDHLSSLDKPNTYIYSYHQGETSLSVKNFPRAISYYKKTVDITLNAKEKAKYLEIAQKSIDALLYSIERTKDNKQANTEYAYMANTTLFPKTENSRKIYPRYFALLLSKKEHENARSILMKYTENFKKDIDKQRTLYISLIDFFIESKDTNLLARNVKEMKSGFFKFNKTYIEKTEVTLGNILFKEFLALEKSGELDKAKSGYRELFNYEHFPKNIRGRAAYNMAIVLSKSKELTDSLSWLKKSYQFLDKKEQKKIVASSLALSETYFLQQNFNIAYDASNFLYKNYCAEKYTEKLSFYNNGIQVALYNNEYDRTLELLEKYKECNINKKDYKSNIEKISNHFILFQQIGNLANFSLRYKSQKGIIPRYYSALIKEYWKAFWNNDDSKKITALNRITHLKDQKLIQREQLRELKLINMLVKFENSSKVITEKKLYDSEKYDEAVFNGNLNKLFTDLGELKKESEALIKSQNSHLVLATYHIMDQNYKAASEKLNSLNLPITDPKYDESYKVSIKNHMLGIAKKLDAEAAKFLTTLKVTVNNQLIFSPYTKYTQSNEAIRSSLGLLDVKNRLATFDM